MRKIIFVFLLLILGSISSLLYPSKIFAQSSSMDCGFRIECVDPAEPDCKLGGVSNTTDLLNTIKKADLIFDLSTIPADTWNDFASDLFTNSQFYTEIDGAQCRNYDKTVVNPSAEIRDTKITGVDYNPDYCEPFSTAIPHAYRLKYNYKSQGLKILCEGNYTVNIEYGATIDIVSLNGLYDVDSEWLVTVTGVKPQDTAVCTYLDDNNLNYEAGNTQVKAGTSNLSLGCNNAKMYPDIHFTLKNFPEPGVHTVTLKTDIFLGKTIASRSFEVLRKGAPTPAPTSVPTSTPPPLPGAPTYTPIPPVPSLAPICEQIDDKYFTDCDKCVNRDHGIWTAIGCLPTDWGALISEKIFPLGLGIAGGVAFLYFLYGVFLILTSAGNAEKIAEGKEIIISALSGLFLIIFSVFLLRVIGYDILRIPGFG